MRALWLAMAVGLIFSALGCATYSERLDRARAATAEGNYEAAIVELNHSLGVSAADEFPDDWEDDHALAALERGSLLQATLEFPQSADNLRVADEELEFLEVERDALGRFGRYTFSDSAEVYRVSPVERMALNASNMLNYLAVDDVAGAAVEARRFTVVREYLEGMEVAPPIGAFGAYFAGLTFEKQGDGNRALRYYEDALHERSLTTLWGPVARLAAVHPYRGREIQAVLSRGGPQRDSAPSEIVVVMSLGRVPYKIPERMPIGAAVGIAGAFISGNPEVLGHAVFKVVSYPELTESYSAANSGDVTIDGRQAPVELLVDLGEAVVREYQEMKPQIIGAALSRMIVRAAAAEGVRQAGKQAGGSYGGTASWLGALITEATLLAFDKPDTRSWSFLAESVWVSRMAVEPGPHDVEVEIAGEGVIVKRDFQVTVPRGKVAVLIVTEPR